MCLCRLECEEQLDESVCLRWRKQIHSLPQGPKRQDKILELYRATLFEKGFNTTTHIVEGKRICK